MLEPQVLSARQELQVQPGRMEQRASPVRRALLDLREPSVQPVRLAQLVQSANWIGRADRRYRCNRSDRPDWRGRQCRSYWTHWCRRANGR